MDVPLSYLTLQLHNKGITKGTIWEQMDSMCKNRTTSLEMRNTFLDLREQPLSYRENTWSRPNDSTDIHCINVCLGYACTACVRTSYLHSRWLKYIARWSVVLDREVEEIGRPGQYPFLYFKVVDLFPYLITVIDPYHMATSFFFVL